MRARACHHLDSLDKESGLAILLGAPADVEQAEVLLVGGAVLLAFVVQLEEVHVQATWPERGPLDAGQGGAGREALRALLVSHVRSRCRTPMSHHHHHHPSIVRERGNV